MCPDEQSYGSKQHHCAEVHLNEKIQTCGLSQEDDEQIREEEPVLVVWRP